MVRKNTSVTSSDKFINVDAPNIIWVVSQSIDVTDPIPHVRLTQEGTTNRMITLSISALRDTSLYKKVGTASSTN